MNFFRNRIALAALILAYCCLVKAETVSVIVDTNAAPRVEFGAEKLVSALQTVNVDAAIVHSQTAPGRTIYLNHSPDAEIGHEGFVISRKQGNQSQTNLETNNQFVIPTVTTPARFMAVSNWLGESAKPGSCLRRSI